MLPRTRYAPQLALSLLMLLSPAPLFAEAASPPPQPAPEVQALLDAAGKANQVAKIDEAERLFQQALEKARALHDRSGEGRALYDLGLVSNDRHQPQKALEYYQQALALSRAIGNRGGEGAVLTSIGFVYQSTGKPQKALEYYLQALPLRRAVGDRRGEAVTLAGIGNVYKSRDEPQKALEYYLQALPLDRAVGNKRLEATTLNNVGTVYENTGEPQKALEYYLQALPLRRAVGDRFGEGASLSSIGLIYSDTGEPQKALKYYLQALTLFRAVGSRRAEANTLTNIGLVYQSTGESQKALEYYLQALPLQRAVGNKQFEAKTLDAIGNVYRDTGEPRKALAFYQQALTLHRAVGDRGSEASPLTNMALVEQRQGHLAEAEAHLAQAVAVLETLRENLGGFSEVKTSFLASHLTAYYSYLDLLLLRHKPVEAFSVAQKMKARALLDLLQDGRVDLSTGLSPEERQQEQELREKTEFLNRQMVKEGVDNEVGAKQRYATLQEKLRTAEQQWQLCTDSLYARHPELARKRAAHTATLEEIGRFLPRDSALLEYIAVPGGRLSLFVVTTARGRARVHVHPIALGSTELTQRAAALRTACADPRRPYAGAARKLYRLLIAPAAKELTGKERLVICPDGPLWDVPFAALMAPARTSQHPAPIKGNFGVRHSGAALDRSPGADTASVVGTHRARAIQSGTGVPHSKGRAGELTRSARFLAQRFEIDYAYSATGAQAVLAERAAKARARPQRTLLAFANPDFGTSKRFGDLDDLPGQRPIDRPSRPIDRPSRPIDVASRPITRPSRAYSLLDRGGRILPLTGTQQEAEALHRLFRDATIYTGASAQEATVKAQAGGCRYLHFATHGFFNDADPLLSSIILAQPPAGSKEDGFLTAREIFDLKLNAEMVVLSSCNSARGEARTGEGVVGMTWALFVAGAPTQVVSQWSVDDQSTARLMERFYRGVKEGKGKGAALREAGLWLMRSRGRDYSHPYYWAPFVLMGDWR